MEDFKRPNHNDFLTAAELKKESFCGVRHNSLTDYMEFWIEGEVIFDMPAYDFATHQDIWKQKMADYLGLHKVDYLPDERN